MSWLDREGASFGQEVWDRIDASARSAADEVRTVRRLLPVVGPLGLAARAGLAEDRAIVGEQEGPGAHVHLPGVQGLPLVHRSFLLGARAVEAFHVRAEPLDLHEAAEAARVVARAEDRLLLEGLPEAGVKGLRNLRGVVQLPAGDWSDPARAADELLAALERLDRNGRHGPYAAAVSPARFYKLLRPYPGGGLTPLAQLQPAFEGGIVKAPALADGALVVMRGESGPRVVVGQELAAAYDGREGVFHSISLVESVGILEGVGGSVAVLGGG